MVVGHDENAGARRITPVLREAFRGSLIANDGYANFYFVNQTKQPGGQVELRECAVTSGIAFDPNGAPQACMGVAATDADRDGLLDLFVTNYYNEANAFYRQTGAEFFVDNTRRAGLFTPSFALLGFRTQFIDGELDGLRDLIITNGDVDDFTAIFCRHLFGESRFSTACAA